MKNKFMASRSHHGNPKVFAGRAVGALTRAICAELGCALGRSECKNFSDGEIWFKFSENIRGADVFLVQSTYAPVENLFELLIMCDAARRASAHRINAVVPYFGYARQDRKDQPRVSITAKLVANMLTGAGADRVLTMDLHAPQIQGFFDLPVDHLYSAPVMTDRIRSARIPRLTIVSPDVGGTNIARAYAKRLDAPIALIDKRRLRHNAVEMMQVIGEVKGRSCLIVDDLCDTAGTLVAAAEKLVAAGATRVAACFTHAVLSGSAVARLDASPLKEIFITDTIPLPPEKRSKKFTVVSIAEIFAKAIQGIHQDESISSLFK